MSDTGHVITTVQPLVLPHLLTAAKSVWGHGPPHWDNSQPLNPVKKVTGNPINISHYSTKCFPNSTSPEIEPQNSTSTQHTQHERKKDRGRGRVDRDKSLPTMLKMYFFSFLEAYFTRTSNHVNRFLRRLQGSWKRSIRGRGPEVWALVASQKASLYSYVRTCPGYLSSLLCQGTFHATYCGLCHILSSL